MFLTTLSKRRAALNMKIKSEHLLTFLSVALVGALLVTGSPDASDRSLAAVGQAGSISLTGYDGAVSTTRDFLADPDVLRIVDEKTGVEVVYLGSWPLGEHPGDSASTTVPSSESRGFEVHYSEVEGTLSVFLYREPLGETRRSAAAYLAQKFGITETDLCRVVTDVRVSPYVNAVYAGKGIGLPHCRGSVVLPGD